MTPTHVCADALKGQVPIALVVLKAGETIAHATLESELVSRVRHEVGPVAVFKHAVVVARLPKTRSGKVLRATMKAIADGTPHKVPATIDDPSTLPLVEAALRTIGYAAVPATA